jgi:hypothetical protein
MKATINKEIELSFYEFSGLIVSALEGGSNYWYWLGETSGIHSAYEEWEAMWNAANPDAMVSEEPLSMRIAYLLYYSDYRIDVFNNENEDEDEVLGIIDIHKCVEGMRLMYNDYPERWAEVKDGNDDADTADVFFQLVVMGNVVFG